MIVANVEGHTKVSVRKKTRSNRAEASGRKLRSEEQVNRTTMNVRSSLARISIILLSFLLSGPAFSDAQFQGDTCIVDNSPGICTSLEKCTSVYEDLLQGKPPRSVCGYDNFEPIVCCPKKVERPTTTTTPTITTTTTLAPTTARPPITGPGAKARSKCDEYASSVYVTKLPPILSAQKVPVNISLCTTKTRKLIVGGKKAEPKEFPHMAAVGYTSNGGVSWLCGGTLISERFVLTAAHCTFNLNWGSAEWVRLGDLNIERSDDNARPVDLRVIERIRHPMYRQPPDFPWYHDIALLKLEYDVTFNAWIRPSCLSYSLPDVGSDGKATATGWGQVDWADERSNDLLKVTISLVEHDACNKSFTNGQKDRRLPLGIVGDWQICAGELGKDTCQGDSGGPLVIFNQDHDCMYNLIGVTSFGKICGSIIPGIYTRVYNYVSWIESVVWPDL